MSKDKKRRGFSLPPSAAAFVDEAKVRTPEHAGRRAVDPVPVDIADEHAGRRSVDPNVVLPGAGHDSALQDPTIQDGTVQHSTEPPPKPWEDLSAGAKGINFTPSPELYAMMMWCKANAPGGISFLEILRQGAEIKCRELIAKYYKPPEE
jgi:hypothetical protein